jgi:hypothetical protein
MSESYNKRALGTIWFLNNIPRQWQGYKILQHGDLDNDGLITQSEYSYVNWKLFTEMVKNFQSDNELVVDGKLGPLTLKRLQTKYKENVNDELFIIEDLMLQEPTIKDAPIKKTIKTANYIQKVIVDVYNKYGAGIHQFNDEISIESALAVFCVESKKAYDNKSGLVIIRFEPHIFRRYTNQEVKVKRGNQEKEWENINAAYMISKKDALYSTSFGLGQIMGFNYKYLSSPFDNVIDMVKDFQDSVLIQIKSFFGFIEYNGLNKFIKDKDWRGFTRRYNGPGNVEHYSKEIISYIDEIENVKKLNNDKDIFSI